MSKVLNPIGSNKKDIALIAVSIYGFMVQFGGDIENAIWADSFYSDQHYNSSSDKEINDIIENIAKDFFKTEMHVYSWLYDAYAHVKVCDTPFDTVLYKALKDIEPDIMNPGVDTDIFAVYNKFLDITAAVSRKVLCGDENIKIRLNGFADVRKHINQSTKSPKTPTDRKVVPFHRKP